MGDDGRLHLDADQMVSRSHKCDVRPFHQLAGAGGGADGNAHDASGNERLDPPVEIELLLLHLHIAARTDSSLRTALTI